MNYRHLLLPLLIAILMSSSCMFPQPDEKTKVLNALIIDGENNHGTWPKTTLMIKDYLEESGVFHVDIARKAYVWQGPHADEAHGEAGRLAMLNEYHIDELPTTIRVDEPQMDSTFSPEFANYDVVISNLGWKASDWPDETKRNFESYMSDGGGLVIIHAANNSFGDWDAYNDMIGLGGWGGRNTASGPYVYYDDEETLVRDTSEGGCGSHGPGFEYVVTTRAPDHPIMKGIPTAWLHAKDELYDRLRGPAQNMTILATAYSDVEGNAPPWDTTAYGTGRHEPAMLTVDHGKGRVFHTIMGHNDYSMECVGFITILQRGSEWAATGEVTIPVPDDFPSVNSSSSRDWEF